MTTTAETIDQDLALATWWRDLRRTSNKAFLDLFFDEHRYLVLMGGGGSGKSIFAGRKVLERVTAEPGHRWLVCRKVAKTLRDSCFAQLRGQLSEHYPGNGARINSSDMRIKFPNGSEILFAGLDDVEKLKSIYDITGIWIEEASELLEADFNQLDIRLRTEFNQYLQMILSFNPISITHWLKRRFFDEIDPRARTHRSTYRDNRFLTSEAIATLEAFKDKDPYYYQVYCLGQWGVTGSTIFNSRAVSERLEEIPEPTDGIFLEGGEFHQENNGSAHIYKMPEPGVPYVIGADTAGDGSDWNVAQVLDNRTGEQVAVLRMQHGEVAFVDQLYQLGLYYNEALIGVETNFSSYGVLELERRRYPNQYVRQAIDSYTHKPTERFGFQTNKNTRETIISNLVEVSSDIDLITDRSTLEEMLTFVRNEMGRAEAEQGAHDDCIMSLAIAHFIRPQQRMTVPPAQPPVKREWTEDMWDDYRSAGPEERQRMIERWGRPN